jgi:hypothetical protein
LLRWNYEGDSQAVIVVSGSLVVFSKRSGENPSNAASQRIFDCRLPIFGSATPLIKKTPFPKWDSGKRWKVENTTGTPIHKPAGQQARSQSFVVIAASLPSLRASLASCPAFVVFPAFVAKATGEKDLPRKALRALPQLLCNCVVDP